MFVIKEDASLDYKTFLNFFLFTRGECTYYCTFIRIKKLLSMQPHLILLI